ncbi:E3 ubiquitin-protein ligase [Thalictrum thalictroides]|uniref:E3 ubiquitin-protein ligase n=1 Tax=Thalictrum thalictroides TaxID=46969 RepID=A0A7J6UYS3_THATH|nr:E3 ubiquitin-protein ligase [Thalictrum thalictroides]
MVFVCMEYRQRHPSSSSPMEARTLQNNSADLENGNGNESSGSSTSSSQEDSGDYTGERQEGEESTSESVANHLESANTMFSFIWWLIGFYWVSAAGPDLTRDAPQLYWLCIVFVAFDVFFVIFCVALACVIGIAVCCFLPCIIAILIVKGSLMDKVDTVGRHEFFGFEEPHYLQISTTSSNYEIKLPVGSNRTMPAVIKRSQLNVSFLTDVALLKQVKRRRVKSSQQDCS